GRNLFGCRIRLKADECSAHIVDKTGPGAQGRGAQGGLAALALSAPAEAEVRARAERPQRGLPAGRLHGSATTARALGRTVLMTPAEEARQIAERQGDIGAGCCFVRTPYNG